MRFLLCGQGTSEILWSVHAALVDLGHESVLALPDISQDVIDRPIDGLFVLNLFEIPRDTVEMLIAYVASLGRRPFVVHICLKHPLEEIGATTPDEVRDADRWMARQGIALWCMCPGTAEQCSRLGLTRVFHAPLGVHRWVYARRSGEDGRIELYKRWMSRTDPDLVRYPYASMKGEADADDAGALVADRILYLGQGWPDEEVAADPALSHTALRVAEVMRAQPALHRTQAMDACGLESMAADPAWTLAFNKAFKFAFAVENRRRFARALRTAFGDRLSIWGNGWDRFGIEAHPVSSKPRNVYHAAAACVDFGSLAFDTAAFPRTLEIIKREGLLVSWQHVDSARLFGPQERDLTFVDEDDAVRTLANLLGDADRRRRLKSAHLDWVFDNLALETILDRIVGGASA
ncbi:glycosyltransferase family protein [Azospirillum sp. sgz302134]